MKNLKSLLGSKLIWLVLVPALLLGAAGMRSITISTQASDHSPVWGSKPVLSYFALTGSLSEAMPQRAWAVRRPIQPVRRVAEQEAGRLRLLEQSSLEVVEDPELSLSEKRLRIDASGYNWQVLSVVEDSRASLQAALDEATYTRLVEWIEVRWTEQREQHGLQSLDRPTGVRTYSIYATRFDTGSYIVALPDGCLKIANGGQRVLYRGGGVKKTPPTDGPEGDPGTIRR